MKKIIVLCSIVLLFASHTSMAQYSNYYFGVYGGKSALDFKYKLPFVDIDEETDEIIDGALVTVPIDDDSSSVGVLIGYEFNDNIQAEFSYLDFGEAESIASYPGFGTFTVAAEYSTLNINVVGTYPISRRWKVHGKFGLSQSSVKTKMSNPLFFDQVSFKEDSDGFYFAAGVLAKISKSFDLTLDYHRFELGNSEEGFQFSASGKSSGMVLGLRYNY